LETDAVIETELDAETLDKALKVLAEHGMTVDELVNRFCRLVAESGVVPDFLLPDPAVDDKSV
jgi:antitoxin component of RelBE/YafQ-DinJ toxin-antitoxin module